MINVFLNGWTLGIATGTTCLATCAPIYIPYLLTEERSGKQSFKIIALITLGRFFAYAGFGAIFGFVGSKIPIHSRQVFTGIAYILLSIYLVISVFRIKRNHKNCSTLKWMQLTRNPFILGVLTGISFCPAFLIAVSNAIDISGIMGGIVLFIAFFIGTSLFIIPITFLGSLSKIGNLRKIAMIASIIVAVVFTYKGIQGIVEFSKEQESSKNKIVESFLSESEFIILETIDNDKWDELVQVTIDDSISISRVKLIDNDQDSLKIFLNRKIPDRSSVILDFSSFDPDIEIEQLLSSKGIKMIDLRIDNFHSQQDFKKMIEFLKNVNFRFDPAEGYKFEFHHPPGNTYERESE